MSRQSLADIIGRNDPPHQQHGAALPLEMPPQRQTLHQAMGGGAPAGFSQRRVLAEFQAPPVETPLLHGSRLADVVDASALRQQSSQPSSRRPQPAWVQGAFQTDSSNYRAPSSDDFAQRAPNLSLKPTSNNIFGVPETQAPYSTTQRDLMAHSKDAMPRRAPNASLRPTSNDQIFGLPVENVPYTTTQRDLGGHQPESFARRAPNLVRKVHHWA